MSCRTQSLIKDLENKKVKINIPLTLIWNQRVSSWIPTWNILADSNASPCKFTNHCHSLKCRYIATRIKSCQNSGSLQIHSISEIEEMIKAQLFTLEEATWCLVIFCQTSNQLNTFTTYLSSLLGLIFEYNSNHTQKWGQICCKSV